MKPIEIDDEVFAYLESKAIPYIETTPNLTLRRLFNLNGKTSSGGISKGRAPQSKDRRRKQLKTKLQTLIKDGLIREGQTLFLHDYQGRRIEGYEAIISGKSLIWNGKSYSMSKLAETCLKKEGYTSNSVQGPARWFNSDDISVLDLWSQLLDGRKLGED